MRSRRTFLADVALGLAGLASCVFPGVAVACRRRRRCACPQAFAADQCIGEPISSGPSAEPAPKPETTPQPAESTRLLAITALAITKNDEKPAQPGFVKLDFDLKTGVDHSKGTPRLYLWVKKGTNGTPITALEVTTNRPSPGFELVSEQNLHEGCGDKNLVLKLCSSTKPANGKPIQDIVITGNAKGPKPVPAGYKRVPQDLNAGCSWFVFIDYKQ
jgi:hypothetical protein